MLGFTVPSVDEVLANYTALHPKLLVPGGHNKYTAEGADFQGGCGASLRLANPPTTQTPPSPSNPSTSLTNPPTTTSSHHPTTSPPHRLIAHIPHCPTTYTSP